MERGINVKISAIIVAAGSGNRMKSEISKQFLKINDKEIFAYSVEKFEKLDCISQIIVVTSEPYFQHTLEIEKKYKWKKTKVIKGGKERQDSVYAGLNALEMCDVVIIHDGVRPFVKEQNILDVINKTIKKRACILAVPMKETVKICKDNIVKETLDRTCLWSIQTPQGFMYKDILKAYKKLQISNGIVTDDAVLMEKEGHEIFITDGEYSNIKITTPEDIIFGKALLEREDLL